MLTGILVRFEPGKLVMAATDSYRLSVKETPIKSDVPELEAIVPARALEELRRIAAGAEQIELGVHENQVVFGAGGVWLTTRRIDGQFPNYKQLLPETFEHEVTLPREELLDVVRRTAVMAQRNSPLRLRFAEGELTVSAQTQDVGEAKESLPAPFTGEPLEIGFNPEFLRDGIESVEGDDVVLKLINPLRPGPDPGRRRRLLVPDHADPPRRLIVASVSRCANFRSYARSSSASSPASCCSSGRTAPARRTCSRRCTSGRRGSRRGRAPTPS